MLIIRFICEYYNSGIGNDGLNGLTNLTQITKKLINNIIINNL